MNPQPSLRAARQLLESLDRAGVSGVPHGSSPVDAGLSQQPADPVAGEVPSTEVVPEEIRVTEPSTSGEPANDDSVAGLAELSDRVAACRRCQELADTRTSTVFGVGDPAAKILFVGEAPGADEDRQGEPFVGRAGKLLNDIIAACGLTREEIYICNILKCRPPGNRNPTADEAENCREYLDGQIAAVNPEYIVCWGTVAAQNLLGSKETIGRLRGRFLEHNGARVLCTYHPSYLLRNPAAKKEVWKDMKILFADMGISLSDKKKE